MQEDFNQLLEKANETYLSNFDSNIWFGRCIFLSWYCDKGTCKFCFRSTIKHKIKYAKRAERSPASIMTDAIIGKNLGWRLEFLTGGCQIYNFEKLLDIIKKISSIFGRKIWINLGTFDEKQLEKLKPYIEGVCASIETVEKNLHDYLCPEKPIEPYSEMLKLADKLGFKKSITIVIGLGEKKEDIELLFDFIEKHNLDRITFYALKPVKETIFTKSPDAEYYAWWIAKTRIRFPKLEIIAGLTPKNAIDYAGALIKAGANALTKFPAIRQFNSENARMIEKIIKESGRRFTSSLTKMPGIDWENEIERLDNELFNEISKNKIKEKLKEYLDSMNL